MIHSTAIIESGAELGSDVEVGAYAFIGAEVRLGNACRVMHHASIDGKTSCGTGNEFHPFSAIGGKSQDLKYQTEPTFLRIGDRNVFREFVTVNRATATNAATQIGNENLFLAYSHIAHDCVIEDHVIFSNNGTLAGHVHVESHVILSGFAAVHQFCRIGAHSMIGGCTKVVQDVPPYFLVDGNPAEPRGLNTVGLQRRGFSKETIQALREAYRSLYEAGLNTSQALDEIEKAPALLPEVKALVDFIRKSTRGIVR